MSLHLKKISDNIEGTLHISGSKSISNRLLIIKGLSESKQSISNLSNSDDTSSLMFYLNMINKCEISGIPMVVDIKNAGTVARFLTALLSFRDGTWLLTGCSRMQQRPIKGLVDALQQIGADISYPSKSGYLPIRITGNDIRGGEIEVDVTKSSQYLSALMLIGPYLEEGLILNFLGRPVSLPYIEMTQKLMEEYGAHVKLTNNCVTVDSGKYNFHESNVEPDWSSASYWYEVVALSKSAEVHIHGLTKNSLQGDNSLDQIYGNLGVTTTYHAVGITIRKTSTNIKEFEYDFNGCPDTVPAVMATCAGLGIKAKFINIGQLAYKESNRIETLTTELKKIGVAIEKHDNYYLLSFIESKIGKLVFDTHNDHRIAMCLAPLVITYDEIEIQNHEVVKKSYPKYWDDFKNLKFAILKVNIK